jgi:excisionase family DNA binding protein
MSRNNRTKKNKGQGDNPAWLDEIPHPADEDLRVEIPPGQHDDKMGVAPVSAVAPLLLTVSDLCALLNVSRMTVYRMEKTGELPGKVKLGGQVRYHREIIEKWLLDQTKN